jgi:hypothetical protein
MKRLQEYLRRRGALDNVCLDRLASPSLPSPVSANPPEHFGITAHPIPGSLEEARRQTCLVVASLSVLYEWPPLDGSYNWMKRLPVRERVGDAFKVYDLLENCKLKSSHE